MKRLDKFISELAPSLPLCGERLSLIKDALLTFKEFENVKKINILELPIVKVNAKTNELLDDSYLGEETKIITAHAMKLRDGQCVFNEEIDLYDISLTPTIYDPNVLDEYRTKVGGWRLPRIVTQPKFEYVDGIMVNWCQKNMVEEIKQSGVEDESEIKRIINERLIKEFTKRLEGDVNVDTRHAVMVRITPRSYKQD